MASTVTETTGALKPVDPEETAGKTAATQKATAVKKATPRKTLTTAKKVPAANKTAAATSIAKKTAAKKAGAPKKAAVPRKSAAKKATTKERPAQKSAAAAKTEYTPSAAFFDLDRTLIRGSANFPLALAAFRAGFVPKRQLAKDVVNAVIFVVGGASDERSAALRERILDAVKGVPVKDVIGLGDEFIPHLAETVIPEAQAELDLMKAEGRDRIIVSASPIEIVQQLADRLGLEGAVGTRSAIKDGMYTGKLAGPFCYGEGKVEAIELLAKERGYNLAASFAYSDSISDLPFMQAVGNAVAINADLRLTEFAMDRGWRIVETRGDTIRVAEAALGLREATEELTRALLSLSLSRGTEVQSHFTARTDRLKEAGDATVAAAQEQLGKTLSTLGPLAEKIPGL